MSIKNSVFASKNRRLNATTAAERKKFDGGDDFDSMEI